MKKLSVLLLAFVLSLMYAASARDFSYTYQGQTVYYTVLDEAAKTCQTKAGSSYESPGNSLSGDLVIPAIVQDEDGTEYTVTTIGAYSFCRNEITSVSLPESVTTLSRAAFSGCEELSKIVYPTLAGWLNITMPNDGTPLPGNTEPGYDLFFGDELVTDVVVPEGTTKINYYAFAGCNSITSISIPETLTEIDEDAFRLCTSLKSVQLPESLTTINRGVFTGCHSLTSINLPSGLTELPFEVFASCYALEQIELPAGLIKIGDLAFSWCDKLRSIRIPSTVTEIGEYAFGSCSNLRDINIYAPTPPTTGDYTFTTFGTLYVPEESIELYKATAPWNQFTIEPNNIVYERIDDTYTARLVKYGSTLSPNVEIPMSVNVNGTFCRVVEIGDSAFYNHPVLQSVKLPSSIQSIGSAAFAECNELTKIRVDAATPPTLGTDAFTRFEGVELLVNENYAKRYAEADGWKNFKIYPLSANALKYEIYHDEQSGQEVAKVVGTLPNLLESVSVPYITVIDGQQYPVVTIADSAFFANSVITSVSIPTSVTSIGKRAFAECEQLTGVYFVRGNTVSIGDYAFADCPVLMHFNNMCISSLGRGAFSNCSAMIRIFLYSSSAFTEIPDDAFSGCVELDYIAIPEGVTRVSNRAFFGCTKLNSISLPTTISEIGDEAFFGAGPMEVKCGAVNLPTIGTNIFSELPEPGHWGGPKLYVPASSVALYEAASPWNEFEVLAMEEDALYYDIRTDGAIGEEYAVVTGRKNNLAPDCVIPSEVTINEVSYSVRAIGRSAFNECQTLRSIIIPESVTAIEAFTFAACTSLETVQLPASITSIGNYAFLTCSKLQDITLPESLEEIRDNAFQGCISLKEINIPSKLTSISRNLFYGCSALAEVNLPESVTTIEGSAFNGCTALTKIEIPESVTSLGTSVFGYCSSLKEVNIPSSVLTLPSGLFNECPLLNKVNLHEKITTIGSSTFYNCASLESFVVPDSLTSVGTFAFHGVENLSKVYVNSLEHWSDIEFGNEWSNPLLYGAQLIVGGESLEILEVPEDAAEVKDYAYAGLKDIVEVIIPETVEAIGSGSFIGCEGLENINIPETVKTIGQMAFKGCTGLISAILGHILNPLSRSAEEPDEAEGVTTIGESAFDGCTALEVVSIGTNVTEIADNVFTNCPALIRIDSYSMIAPDLSAAAFEAATTAEAELHVPMGCALEYETAMGWSAFATVIDDLPVDPSLAVNLNMTEVSIVEEETVQLTATMASGEGAFFTWTSSDTEVATVSESGLVKGITAGTATITVTASTGVRATCAVTVTPKSTGAGALESEELRVEGNTIIAPEGSMIYDLSGYRIYDSSNLAPGTYIVRMTSGEIVKVSVK